MLSSRMRILLAILILATPLATPVHNRTPLLGQAPRAQNIFLFTVDSCRADRIGAYNKAIHSTPNIDAWAGTGTVFLNAYSTSAWTAPGLVSILSGLDPPTHGVRTRDNTGPRDLPTLVKILQDRGYRVPNINFFTFASYYQNLGLGPIERTYFGKESGDELLNWLNREVGKEKPEPFFVWYHSTLVHQPYNPPAELLPAPRHELEKSPGIRAVLNGAIVPVGSARFTEQDKPVLNQLYTAEIGRMDRLFNRALDILRTKGALEDTLVVLTADHGEELLGFVGHASTSLQAKLYEELIRIPLIVSWPGRVPVGRVSDVASQIDVLPTVLNLLNISLPEIQHGRDLFGGQLGERTLFFESALAGNQTTRENEDLWVRAVRKGNLKYISSEELYDLAADPQEQTNLILRNVPVSDQLRGDLERWLNQQSAQQIHFDFSKKVDTPLDQACPSIFTPENGRIIDYDVHTGAILIDWTGDRDSTYLVQYQIGEGDHHVAGIFEAQGNHQLLGPLNRELWSNLRAWNPFLIRVAARTANPCWSDWTRFEF